MTLKDYLNTGDRFAAGSGARLVEIAPGSAVAELKVTSAHLNAGGVCQGGAIFTLADLVFAALVNQGENLTFAINSTIYYHVSAREGENEMSKMGIIMGIISMVLGFGLVYLMGTLHLI